METAEKPAVDIDGKPVRVYERSRCRSFASAYRDHILIGEVDSMQDALALVEDWTDDSYCCFALAADGTAADLFGEFPAAVEPPKDAKGFPLPLW